jgi:uncharacterized protein (TIGR02646 family)
MRSIRKGTEPPCLTKVRQQANATYDSLYDLCKQEVRLALCSEQGFLCCYCMQRIEPTPQHMKIEHFVPQTAGDNALDLAWHNLLGACPGSEGKPRVAQHCDSRKADARLSFSPTDPHLKEKLHFLANGRLEAPEYPAIQQEIDKILNLNCAQLQNNRKAAVDAFRFVLERERSRGWSSDFLNRKIAGIQSAKNGRLPEYVQVLVYWLEKQLKSHLKQRPVPPD